jgi:hypothetical protein
MRRILSFAMFDSSFLPEIAGVFRRSASGHFVSTSYTYRCYHRSDATRVHATENESPGVKKRKPATRRKPPVEPDPRWREQMEGIRRMRAMEVAAVDESGCGELGRREAMTDKHMRFQVCVRGCACVCVSAIPLRIRSRLMALMINRCVRLTDTASSDAEQPDAG